MNVVKLVTPKRAKPAPIAKHPDDTILTSVARWRIARSQILLADANFDLMTKFYTTSEEGPNISTATAWREIEGQEAILSICKPKTGVGAMALLGVVTDILQFSEDQPGHNLAQGNVIVILRNVRDRFRDNPNVKLRELKQI